MLHGQRRHDQRLLRRHMQARVHELVGKQRFILIGEARLELDGACCHVDLVVQRHELARGDKGRIVSVVQVDCQRLARAHLAQHIGQLCLRQSEQHGNRLGLRNDDQAVGVRRVDHVALVKLAQPQPPRNRCDDAGKAELQFGAVDRRLVTFARTQELLHQRRLRIHLLTCDRILLEQQLVALQIALRVQQLRLVLLLLPQRLVQLHLEIARVDLREQVAFPHFLAVDK